jgi:hypothetical protein
VFDLASLAKTKNKKKKKNQAWWYRPAILATQKVEAGSPLIKGQAGLYSEFQAIVDCIMKPFSKTKI